MLAKSLSARTLPAGLNATASTPGICGGHADGRGDAAGARGVGTGETPDAAGEVPSGQEAAVGAKGDGVDRSKIQNGPGNAPPPGGMIPASAREHRAVRTEGDRRYNRR